jgi:DnaA family protein
MKQIALDIGLATGPTLASYFPGPNEAAWRHLEQWAGVARSVDPVHSPVPSYLWGAQGSGKSHLLKAAQAALREQGARVGWLDAGMLDPPEYDEDWAAVIFDDVQLYSASQQQVAFKWFVNAQTHQRAVLAAGAMPPVELQLRAWAGVMSINCSCWVSPSAARCCASRPMRVVSSWATR